MEIAILSKKTIRIKGKQATLLIDPDTTIKTMIPTDGVLFLEPYEKTLLSKVEGHRVVIKGPGEYEVGGIKISGFASGKNVAYSLLVDGVHIGLVQTTDLEKAKEKLTDEHIILLSSSESVDQAFLTALAPKVLIAYGEKAGEVLKTVGSEAKTLNKYATTVEKLPA